MRKKDVGGPAAFGLTGRGICNLIWSWRSSSCFEEAVSVCFGFVLLVLCVCVFLCRVYDWFSLAQKKAITCELPPLPLGCLDWARCLALGCKSLSLGTQDSFVIVMWRRRRRRRSRVAFLLTFCFFLCGWIHFLDLHRCKSRRRFFPSWCSTYSFESYIIIPPGALSDNTHELSFLLVSFFLYLCSGIRLLACFLGTECWGFSLACCLFGFVSSGPPPFLQSVLSFWIPKPFLSLSSLCVSLSVLACFVASVCLQFAFGFALPVFAFVYSLHTLRALSVCVYASFCNRPWNVLSFCHSVSSSFFFITFLSACHSLFASLLQSCVTQQLSLWTVSK